MKGLLDKIAAKRSIEGKAKEALDNVGVLLASGLIAGEALLGLLFAGLAFAEVKIFHVFESPWYVASLICILILGVFLVQLPLRKPQRGE